MTGAYHIDNCNFHFHKVMEDFFAYTTSEYDAVRMSFG